MASAKSNKASGRRKAQMSIEYLTVFTVAIVLLIIVVIIVSSVFTNQKAPTPSPTSCYISAQLNCLQVTVSGSSSGAQSTAVVVFTNNLGIPITFQNPGLVIYPTASQAAYSGLCYPTNAVQGSEVICNATLTGYSASSGTELTPRFELKYRECTGGPCTGYNTSGTSTLYVSSNVPLSNVQLFVNPTTGEVTLDGSPYPSGTTVDFTGSKQYYVFASAPGIPSAIFHGWFTTGSVAVASASALATTAEATGGGTLTAAFAYPVNIIQDLGGASETWDAYFVYQSQGYSEVPPAEPAYATPGASLGIGYNMPNSPGCGDSDYGASYTEYTTISGCSPNAAAEYYLPTTGTSITSIDTTPATYYSYRYEFTGFSNAYTSSSETNSGLAVPVKKSLDIQANYVIPCYAFSISDNVGGAGASITSTSPGMPSTTPGLPSCAPGSYTPDTTIHLNAAPLVTYLGHPWEFGQSGSSWTSSGSNPYDPTFTELPPYGPGSPGPDGTTGTSTSYTPTVTMRENIQETATYVECYQLTLNYNPSEGSPSEFGSPGCPSGYFPAGTTVTLNANPNSPNWGWNPSSPAPDNANWAGGAGSLGAGSDSGAYSGTQESGVTVTMTGDISESITYTQCFPLTLYANPSSGGNPGVSSTSNAGGCGGYYAYGGSITISSNPNSNWQFQSWSGTSSSSSDPWSFNIYSSTSETALYYPCLGTSTDFGTEYGSESQWISGSGCYQIGSTVTITLTAPGSSQTCNGCLGQWYDGWDITTISTSGGVSASNPSACNTQNPESDYINYGDVPSCSLTVVITGPGSVNEPFNPCITAQSAGNGQVDVNGGGYSTDTGTTCVGYNSVNNVGAQPNPKHTFGAWNCYDDSMEHSVTYDFCYGTNLDYNQYPYPKNFGTNNGAWYVTQPTIEVAFFN